jgi:hypothetical protein
MARKSQNPATTEAATIEHNARLTPRRITPKSFRSPLKRRKAEKTLARTGVAGSFTIFGRGLMMLRNHWEVFGGLFLIYAIINTIFTATTLATVDLQNTKDALGLAGNDKATQFGTGLALVETLFSSGASTATGPSGAYQSGLFIIISLAIVWALRQISAGNKIRIRDTLYNSTYSLVPLILVVLFATVQLLPAALGAFLANSLLVGGILTVAWQKYLVGFAVFLLIVWSFYMIISTIVALYIVTLPDMTPLKAIRSAKEIVRYRRASVLVKLLFLPVVLLIIGALILVPLSLLSPWAATIMFFLLGMVALPVSHAYLYTLYRELIAT